MKLSILKSLALIITFAIIYTITTSSSNGNSGSALGGCSCHGPLSPSTSVTFSGFPMFYTNGATYPITVVISNLSKIKAGFKFAVNIGTLSNPGTGVTITSPLQAKHTSPKTMGSGSASFTFNWTAPLTGNILLTADCSGNAVDNSLSTTGDTWNNAKSLNVPLPVTISNLKVTQHNDNALINWTIEDERDIKGYTIEKSTNGVSFTTLKEFNSTNKTIQNFEFEDTKVEFGTNYYRLKITQIEGDYYYSGIKYLSINSNKLYTVNSQELQLNNIKDIEANIYTLTGARILTTNTSHTSLDKLPQGIYIISIINARNKAILQTDKFVKQ
jgi:hypothetical protein